MWSIATYINSVLAMVVSTTGITQKIWPRLSATWRHKPGKMPMTWRPTLLSSNCESWSHLRFFYNIHDRLIQYTLKWASMCRLILIPISCFHFLLNLDDNMNLCDYIFFRYQFNPAYFQTQVTSQILLKALTNLPHTDFTLCKCMIDQTHVSFWCLLQPIPLQ